MHKKAKTSATLQGDSMMYMKSWCPTILTITLGQQVHQLMARDGNRPVRAGPDGFVEPSPLHELTGQWIKFGPKPFSNPRFMVKYLSIQT